MSPSATIATVVVALVFLAWLFQSDAKDPGYEAWLRRQQEQAKAENAQKAAAGVNVTDPGVTKDNSRVTRRGDPSSLKGYDPGDQGGGLVVHGISNVLLPVAPGDPANATTQPAVYSANPGFSPGTKLNGTFVGVALGNELPTGRDLADAPSITFRGDGTFATQNMAAADVDMEAGGLFASERGSGRYAFANNTLDLTYTDGLSRTKGNKRTYTVVPVQGDDAATTALTIQGKLFKLDPAR